MLNGEVPPAVLEEACGGDPTYICEQVLELTDSEGVAETADVLLSKPFSILLVVVVAWVVLVLLHRVIDRFVASLAGQNQPSRRIKRTLRRSPIVAQTLRDGALDTGSVSVRAAARAETLGHVLHSVAAFTVWTIAVITILGELGVNLGPLIAGAGIAGIALGFGAQSLVKDFLAGIFIIVEDQYGVGDNIDVGELSGTPVSGTVESVSLRATKLRSVNGTVWHVPNGTVLRVGNMSQQWARALLDVSVAYGSDLELAQAEIKRVADELWQDSGWAGQVLEEPELWGVEALAADGVTIRLVVKTLPAEQFKVLRELRARIKAALDAAGVEIPTVQRTVWVRRGPGSPDEDDLDAAADPPS
ncbi:MAG: mechanosensitive ion channel family protein [Acidimicrobiales bacterium]